MKADFHIHSSFSADSDWPMAKMIEKGISLGLNVMCFTEHMDFDFISDGLLFEVDTDRYFEEFSHCQKLYQADIDLRFGVELGLVPGLSHRLQDYLNRWDFDFVIGSSHLIDGKDPYYPNFFENRTEESCYLRYFETIPENIAAFSDIDIYGHLDYIIRYGPNKNKYYSYEDYRDIIDMALRSMINAGIGLELNTAGYKYGLGHPNPHPDILKRYRELGGEILTIGSDAHEPSFLAAYFIQARELLSTCGFQYYTIYKARKPEFIKL